MTQVFFSIVEPILALLQVRVERASRDFVELLEPTLGIAPEALNAVDVMLAPDKLVLPVIDSEVLRVSDIDKAIIASPAVRVDDRFRSHSTANNGLKRGFLAIRHDLGVDASVTLEDAEDNRLATGSTASLAKDATRAEVGFINFDFATRKGQSALALFSNVHSLILRKIVVTLRRESLVS
jgi:hypothetical protein